MEAENKAKIKAKFSALMNKSESIFNPGLLKYKFNREDLFQEKFDPFLESLKNEIKSLPRDKVLFFYLDYWITGLTEKIEKAKRKERLSEIGRIFLTGRKKLRTELSEINSDLMNTEVPVKETPKAANEAPVSFREIFIVPDWKKYIEALYMVDNPIVDTTYKFIGQPKKHKGVVCSWIKELQAKGKIDKKFSRQQLAAVLNHEILGLNLGEGGKTFDNVSLTYDNEYKSKLIRLTNLLP